MRFTLSRSKTLTILIILFVLFLSFAIFLIWEDQYRETDDYWGQYAKLYKQSSAKSGFFFERKFEVKVVVRNVKADDGTSEVSIIAYNPVGADENIKIEENLQDRIKNFSSSETYQKLIVSRNLLGKFTISAEPDTTIPEYSEFLWFLFEDMIDDMGVTYYEPGEEYIESLESPIILPPALSLEDSAGADPLKIIASQELLRTGLFQGERLSKIQRYIDENLSKINYEKTLLPCFVNQRLGRKYRPVRNNEANVAKVSIERIPKMLSSFYYEGANLDLVEDKLVMLVDKLYFCPQEKISVYVNDLEYILGTIDSQKSIGSSDLYLLYLIFERMEHYGYKDFDLKNLDDYINTKLVEDPTITPYYVNCLIKDCSKDLLLHNLQANLKTEGQIYHLYGTSVDPALVLLVLLSR